MTQQIVSKPPKARLRAAIASLFATGAFAMAPGASADVVPWTLEGPGDTSVNRSGDFFWLNYDAAESAGNLQAWSATAVADEAGDYHFFWRYAGNHGTAGVTFLNAVTAQGAVSLLDAGNATCCTMIPGAFSHTGSYSFTNVAAGDMLRFTFGGQGFDGESFLQGSLGLLQYRVANEIPEPASLALLGLGLAAGLAARRRTRH